MVKFTDESLCLVDSDYSDDSINSDDSNFNNYINFD